MVISRKVAFYGISLAVAIGAVVYIWQWWLHENFKKLSPQDVQLQRLEVAQKFFAANTMYVFDPASETCVGGFSTWIVMDNTATLSDQTNLPSPAWVVECCKVRDRLAASVQNQACPKEIGQNP